MAVDERYPKAQLSHEQLEAFGDIFTRETEELSVDKWRRWRPPSAGDEAFILVPVNSSTQELLVGALTSDSTPWGELKLRASAGKPASFLKLLEEYNSTVKTTINLHHSTGSSSILQKDMTVMHTGITLIQEPRIIANFIRKSVSATWNNETERLHCNQGSYYDTANGTKYKEPGGYFHG